MNKTLSMYGIWSGAAFVGLFLIAFVFFAQWVPPMSPTLTAEQIASLFSERSVPLRVCALIITLVAALYLPWSVMIAELVQKSQGESRFLSWTIITCAVLASITFFIPGYMWAVVAFREGRDPQIIQLIVDLGWLIFITGIGPFIIQYAALAVAIFQDNSDQPLFPRWFDYFQLWILVSFFPALLAFFMKTGPFAWNGLFVWWIPLTLFTLWFLLMAVYCRRAILNSDLPLKGLPI